MQTWDQAMYMVSAAACVWCVCARACMTCEHVMTNTRSERFTVHTVGDCCGWSCAPCSRFHARPSVPEGEPDFNDYMMSHFMKSLEVPDLVEAASDTHH